MASTQIKSTAESRFLYSNEAMKLSLLRWWQSQMLPIDELKAKKIQPAPSGMKARLKRCESVDAAMMSEGFQNLWQCLPENLTEHATANDIERWATLAAALVCVKQDGDMTFAMAAGSKGKGEGAVVSEMRFAQLQSAKTSDEFLRRLRRILQQINGKVGVISLAKNIEQWFLEQNESYPRKADKRICVQWAMEYYRAQGMKKSAK